MEEGTSHAPHTYEEIQLDWKDTFSIPLGMIDA